jgi:hypothetical protein
MGAGIGHAGSAANDGGANVGDAYTWNYATTDASDTYHHAGELGETLELPGIAANGGSGYVDSVTGEFCLDPFNNNKPYTQGTRSDEDAEDETLSDGGHCIPVAQTGNGDGASHSYGADIDAGALGMRVNDETFVRALPVRAQPGPNAPDLTQCPGDQACGEPHNPTQDATSWPVENQAAGVETGFETLFCLPKYATQNGGMKFPPNDVTVTVTDNDVISEQDSAAIASCKQTSLYSYPDDSARKSEWLVDYNCDNGDAGGLPGYPAADGVGIMEGAATDASTWRRNLAVSMHAEVLGDAHLPGDAQCANGRVGAYCDRCPEGMNVTGSGCA